jgi:hypothetical protein
MNTSTNRGECMNMPLYDFVEFVEDLGDEAERVRKQQERGDG